MSTPGLVFKGKVASCGKTLSKEKVRDLFEKIICRIVEFFI